MKEEDNRKLNVFENDRLRTIVGVFFFFFLFFWCMNHIKMDDKRSDFGIADKIPDIIKKILKRFGHMICKDNATYVNHLYKNDFANRKPRGQPSNRWSGLIREDTQLLLLTLERLDGMKVLCGQICVRILADLYRL